MWLTLFGRNTNVSDRRWEVIVSETLLTISHAVERPIPMISASVVCSILVANFHSVTRTATQSYKDIAFWNRVSRLATYWSSWACSLLNMSRPIRKCSIQSLFSHPHWTKVHQCSHFGLPGTPNCSNHSLVNNCQQECIKKANCLFSMKKNCLKHCCRFRRWIFFPLALAALLACLLTWKPFMIETRGPK